jgi:hypothetical protein
MHAVSDFVTETNAVFRRPRVSVHKQNALSFEEPRCDTRTRTSHHTWSMSVFLLPRPWVGPSWHAAQTGHRRRNCHVSYMVCVCVRARACACACIAQELDGMLKRLQTDVCVCVCVYCAGARWDAEPPPNCTRSFRCVLKKEELGLF